MARRLTDRQYKSDYVSASFSHWHNYDVRYMICYKQRIQTLQVLLLRTGRRGSRSVRLNVAQGENWHDFYDVTLCSWVCGSRRLRKSSGSRDWSSKMKPLTSFGKEPHTHRHSLISQKTWILLSSTAVRTSDVAQLKILVYGM